MQLADESLIEPLKKVKTEEIGPKGPSLISSYPYLYPPISNWCTDPSILMYWYPALAATHSEDPNSFDRFCQAYKPWIQLKQNYDYKFQMTSQSSNGLPPHLANKFNDPPVLQNPDKIVPFSQMCR